MNSPGEHSAVPDVSGRSAISGVPPRFWIANPHIYGPGRVHGVDDEDSAKTLCGRRLQDIPGRAHLTGPATCLTCLATPARREARRDAEARWREAQRQRDADAARYEQRRADADRAWWARYHAYLASEAWLAKRRAVLRRAGGLCEACASAAATEIHHLTYRHVFHEPLFELVAICGPCHEQITALDRQSAP